MTREERDRLLVRYNNRELNPLERERLFSEALQDQELFELLFEDEALNEALADPEVRRDLLAVPLPRRAQWHERWRWPVLAGLAASLVLGVVLIRYQMGEGKAPVMMAENRPAPVTSIEPILSPMPEKLGLPAVPPPRAKAIVQPEPVMPKETATVAVAEVADTAVESFAAAPSPAGLPAMRGRGLALQPFEARFEVQSGEGLWRVAEDQGVLPAGRPVRLAIVGRAMVGVTVGSDRVAVRPGETHYLDLPEMGVGEHEIRIEWGGLADAGPMTTLAESGGSARTLGPGAGSRIMRVRVR